jgi:putative hydrolase of the HAD superfamily
MFSVPSSYHLGKIKAVAFDFGNVICLPQAEGTLEKLAAIAGLDLEVFSALFWTHRAEYDRGSLSGIEYYRGMLAPEGVFPDDETLGRMLAIDLASWTRINPDTVQFMEDVQKAGLKLGILSNMPFDFLALARKQVSVFQRADARIFSCEIGSIKPETRIYEAALSALNCTAEELVFFDDIPVNVEKARSMGIRAFIWRNAETARSELNSLSLSL